MSESHTKDKQTKNKQDSQHREDINTKQAKQHEGDTKTNKIMTVC